MSYSASEMHTIPNIDQWLTFWLSSMTFQKALLSNTPFFLQNSSFSNKLPLLKSPPPPCNEPTLSWKPHSLLNRLFRKPPPPSSEPPSLKAPLSKKPPSLKCSPLSPFPGAPKPLKILNCKVYSEHYPYSEPCELHESRMQFTLYIKVQTELKRPTYRATILESSLTEVLSV